MAQPNNTIPPTEEQKKPEPVKMPTFESASPTGTYYGEQGNEQADVMQRMISEWAAKTDPKAQAEQDAKTQRARSFWTGANLFANVIANAINANGTAKGAPNMTFNDNASQQMYESWRTSDRELRADRRAAQQRVDALRMQDAQMRAAGAEKRASEQRHADDMNFRVALENAQHERGRQEAEADWNRNQQAQIDAEKRQAEQQVKMAGINNAAAAARQKAGFEHAEKMADKTEERQTKMALIKKGYDPDQKRVLVGNGYFKAENQNEAANHIWAVYEMLRNAYNADDGTGKARTAGMPMSGYLDATSDIDEATAFIGRTFRSVYKNNPAFKAEYDEYSKEYGASAAAKQKQQTQTPPSGHVR